MKTPNVLIGGATNSGKTVLARRLVDQHGYSRIPGDPLVLGFQEVFPDLGIAHTREGFAESCRQFGRFLVSLARALPWESQMHYVLDSFYFRPGDVADLDRTKTTIIFLGYADADPDEKLSQLDAWHGGTWPNRKGMSDTQAKDYLQLFLEMSRRDRDDCARLGFLYVDTGVHFEDSIEAAEKALTED